MELRADCDNCLALCCVALAFASPADFAISKPAGEPCRHLATDLRCGIHDQLRGRGFSGCDAYDCFGAGQRVSASVSGDWRTSPSAAADLFAALPVVTRLHELLWYIEDAAGRDACRPLSDELADAASHVDALAASPAVTAVDPEAARRSVAPLLERASVLVRKPAGRALRHADLAGRDLRDVDLTAADLRGSVLLGADLRGADLRSADVIGADLRGADLRGADLGAALFATSAQLAGARGDAGTVVPPRVSRPVHWN